MASSPFNSLMAMYRCCRHTWLITTSSQTFLGTGCLHEEVRSQAPFAGYGVSASPLHLVRPLAWYAHGGLGALLCSVRVILLDPGIDLSREHLILFRDLLVVASILQTVFHDFEAIF